MKIVLGKVVLDKPVILAPLDGYTNIPFRLIMKEMGPDLMYTEFVNSDAIIYSNKKTLAKIKILKNERPVAIQLFGKNPENMAKAAKIIAELEPEVIDLNFGCPSPSVAGHGSGSALLKDLPLMGRVCEKVVNAVDIPVTAKTRIGWDNSSINILQAGKVLENSGIKMITLHPRTRAQRFKFHSDWRYITVLKQNSKIPIIGNGDINTPEDAKKMFDETNCDGIMIGRAAVKHPWLFKQINDFLTTGEYQKEIPFDDRIEMCLRHYDYALEYRNEISAQFEMRKLYQNYFRGVSNFKRFRKIVFDTTDPMKVREHIVNIKDILEDASIDNML